jgi:hypothetical protein
MRPEMRDPGRGPRTRAAGEGGRLGPRLLLFDITEGARDDFAPPTELFKLVIDREYWSNPVRDPPIERDHRPPAGK